MGTSHSARPASHPHTCLLGQSRRHHQGGSGLDLKTCLGSLSVGFSSPFSVILYQQHNTGREASEDLGVSLWLLEIHPPTCFGLYSLGSFS